MSNVLKIRPSERRYALAVVVYLLVLQLLMWQRYLPGLLQMPADYARLFEGTIHVSGFDSWTCSTLSHYTLTEFNAFRHPLLALLLLPLWAVNYVLMQLTGYNCAFPLMELTEGVFAFYGALFFLRILTDALQLKRRDAYVVAAYFYGFGYVMLTVMVPDHFNISMTLLLFTLWQTGCLMRNHELMSIRQTGWLYVFTAGVSLNNGVKTLLAAWFSRGKKFWQWRYLLRAVVLPAVVVLGAAALQNHYFIAPLKQHTQQLMAQRNEKERALVAGQFRDTTHLTDSAAIAQGIAHELHHRAMLKYEADHKNPKIGKPMAWHVPVLEWTDVTTSRWETAVENLFGESIQLHKAHLLEDIFASNRPMITYYLTPWPYIVEAVIVVLMLLGLWCGRRCKLMWLTLCFAMIDMLIHMVLGFAINEVYIMAGHWIYAVPLITACALKNNCQRVHNALWTLLLLLTVYLWVSNGWLIGSYLIK